MKKAVLFLMVLVVVGVAGAFGFNIYVKQQATSQVDATLASLPGIKTAKRGPVDYDFFEDKLLISNLELEFLAPAGTVLKIAELELEKLGSADGGSSLSAGEVEYKGLSLVTGPWPVQFDKNAAGSMTLKSFDIAEGEIEDLLVRPGSFSGLDFGGLEAGLDLSGLEESPEVMIGFYQTLSRIELALAEGLDVGRASHDQTVMSLDMELMDVPGDEGAEPETVKFAIDLEVPAYSLEGWKAGRIAKQKGDSWAMNMVVSGPEQVTAKVTGGAYETDGYNLANIARIYLFEDADAGREPLIIADRMVMADTKGTVSGANPGESVSFSIAEVVMEDYRIRPFSESFMNFASREPDPEALNDLMAEFGNMMKLGLVKFTGIEGAMAEEGGSFRLDSLELAGYEVTKIDDLHLQGMAVEVPEEGNFSLDGFRLSGLDYSAIMAAMPTVMMEETLPLGSLPKLELFEIAGLEMAVEGETVALGRLAATSADYVNSVPQSGSFELSGLSVPAVLMDDPMAMAFLQLMGRERVDFSARSDYRWDMAQGSFQLDPLELSLMEMGQLNLDLSLGQMTEEIMKAMHGQVSDETEAAMGAIEFHGGRLFYQDQSLVPGLFQAFAGMSGQTEEQMKADILVQAQQMAAVLEDPELTAEIVAALETFLRDPQSLEIRFAPAEPLQVGVAQFLAFAAPGDLAKGLGLRVMANGQE